MEYKIINDTSVNMNEKEIKEHLTVNCPICGKKNEPYLTEEFVFSPKVKYYYQCSDTHVLNSKKNDFYKVEGCGCRWFIKLNPKQEFKKINIGKVPYIDTKKKENKFKRLYLNFVSKLSNR